MALRDFGLMMLVCLMWALNIIFSSVVMVDFGVPPLFYAGVRYLAVALVLMRYLRPLPEQIGQLIMVGLLIGAVHFGLMFLGLRLISASLTSIILQMNVPFAAIFALLILGEKISAARALGIAITFMGVVITLWDGGEVQFSALGVGLMLGSALAIASGSVLLKRRKHMPILNLQAWASVSSMMPLAMLSFVLERDALEYEKIVTLPFAAAVLFSVFVVTIWAHSTYLTMLQRYSVAVVAPPTLVLPIMTVVLGITFLGEEINLRIILGMAVVLGGVACLQLGDRFSAARALTRA